MGWGVIRHNAVNPPLAGDDSGTQTRDVLTTQQMSAEIVRGDRCGGSSRYVFSGERLVQALAYWCSSVGVPLPRRGHKAVQASNGELQLSITLESAQERDAYAQLAA